ncbi:sensor histidine kinase [Streptomyces sporangiiformans]|uniref:Oxygen sensor histidine kinase NreB n=1 Tax=Streptomyces sporangiiformans TaxID=2315329 RepID=A0A505D2G9_9ACTN|nr:sensor histidine kinase [Streptomyces sporangiiformans]TPQ17027.1 sensor histidine kinase [Streptomyces sporangiiformans]
MSGPLGARTSNIWEGSFRVWDWYFSVVWVATLVFVVGADFPGWPVRVVAAGLLLPLIPWYLLVGRPLLMSEEPDEHRALGYIAGAMALFLPSAVLVGESRMLTFALVPQCLEALRMRWAMIAVTVINLVPVAGWALLWRPSGHEVLFNFLFAVVTLVFSIAVGTWVIRIIEQSKERGELIAELEASRHEISRLSAAHGALAERERLSREIHDTLAQGFTSLLMLTQAVEAELDQNDVAKARRHLTLMDETARQNLAEARALVAGGAPADLDGASLPDALRRLATRHDAGLDVVGPVRALPAGPEVVALRSCQEALTNARRHAGSSATVSIALAYADDTLTVSVQDDGSGFDPAAPCDGYGLAGLRARAAEVGGTALVHSAPGGGTTVTVRLPVPAELSPELSPEPGKRSAP